MFFVFESVFVYKWDVFKRWEKTTEAYCNFSWQIKN